AGHRPRVGHRHEQPRTAGPQPRPLPLREPGHGAGSRRDRAVPPRADRLRAGRPGARIHRRRPPRGGRPAVPRGAAANQP
ncbi:MAG: DEAD/DEAH box helicase, partial [bacterium]